MKASAILAGLAVLSTAIAAPADWDDKKGGDAWGWKKFTSTYNVVATPGQVINMTDDGEYVRTGGLPGAKGLYKLALDSKSNTICYDITLYNFRGRYESAAITATHLHEAPRGKTGPPRIAFSNPKKTSKKNVRKSKGCMKGPFRTGIIDEATGRDTGAGFSVSQIEANPSGFFADVHSSLAVPGAVRGQLS